jgi:hypothetical protein
VNSIGNILEEDGREDVCVIGYHGVLVVMIPQQMCERRKRGNVLQSIPESSRCVWMGWDECTIGVMKDVRHPSP